MADTSQTAAPPYPGPTISMRPTLDDQRIVYELHKKLGVDTSQIFRLAIRLLAAKEGVSA